MPVQQNKKIRQKKKKHHADRDDLTPEFPFWDQIQIIIMLSEQWIL